MTTQEAIDILYKSVPEAISENYELPALIGRAKEAIEKQIPMQIKEVHIDEYICPACGAENLCDQGIVQDKFCPNCGQALDWRDEK